MRIVASCGRSSREKMDWDFERRISFLRIEYFWTLSLRISSSFASRLPFFRSCMCDWWIKLGVRVRVVLFPFVLKHNHLKSDL